MSGSDNTIELGIGVGDSAQLLQQMEQRLNAVFKALESVTDGLSIFGVSGHAKFQEMISDLKTLQTASKLNPALLTPYVAEVERAAAATTKLAAIQKEVARQAAGTPASLQAARRSDSPEVVQAGLTANQANINAALLRKQEAERKVAFTVANAGIKERVRSEGELLAASKQLENSLSRQVVLQERLTLLQERERVARAADQYNRVQPQIAAARAGTPRGIAEAEATAQRERVAIDRIAATQENASRDRIQRATPAAQGQSAVAQAAIRAGGARYITTDDTSFKSLVESTAAARDLRENVTEAIGPSRRQTQALMDRQREQLANYQSRAILADANFENQARNRRAAEVSSAEREDFRRDPYNAGNATISRNVARAAQANALGSDPNAIAALAKAKDDIANLSAQIKAARAPQPTSGLSVDEEARRNIARKDRASAVEESERNQRIKFGNTPAEGPAPRTQAQVLQSSRERRNEYITGDGGANLLTTQAYIQTNYLALDAVFRGFKAGVAAVLEFDKALKNLQAVTGTTDGELKGLETTILGISKASTFSATDLAKSAEDLAKAGFSLKEVVSILQATSVLASATGTSLIESTDVLKGVFTTFNVGAGETTKVLDQVFTTLNTSRVTVDKYKASLGEAGVTAKENGLTFAEFNAGLVTLSNTGLTSGQQLNQGYRQVLTALSEPTAKFQARLAELGVSLEDLDPKVHGFVGVFETLNKAGFTTADAFNVLNTRVATTFATFLTSTQAYKANYSAQLDATGAAEAQAKALTSVIDQAQILGNTFTSLAVTSSGVLKGALTEILVLLNHVTGAAASTGPAFTVLTTVLAAASIVAVGSRIGSLAVGLNNLSGGSKIAAASVNLFNVAAGRAVSAGEAASVSVITLSGAFGALFKAVLPLAIIGGIITALSFMASSTSDAADASSKLQEAETSLHEKLEEKQKSLEKVQTFIESVSARSKELRTDNDKLGDSVQEARNQFGSLSEGMQGNIKDFDTLIAKLVNLRTELRAATGGELAALNDTIKAKADLASQAIQNAGSQNSLLPIAAKLGVSTTKPVEKPTGFSGDDEFKTGPELLSSIGSQIPDTGLSKKFTDFISSPNKTQVSANDLLTSLRLARDAPNSTLPADKANVLIEAVNNLSAHLTAITTGQGQISTNNQTIHRDELSTQFANRGLNTNLIGLNGLVANDKQLNNIQGGNQRSDALKTLQDDFNHQAQGIESFLSGLTPGDKTDFLSTKEGQNYLNLKTALDKRIAPAVQTYVNAEAVFTADETVKSLKATLSRQKKEITEATDPAVARALTNASKATALELRDVELAQVEARARTSKKDKLFGPQATELAIRNETNVVQENYQSNLDSINASQNRVDKRKQPFDANGNLPPVVPNYERELSSQETRLDKTTETQLRDSKRPLDAREALINAETETKQFPTATLNASRKDLNDLKIANEAKDMDILLSKIAGLNDIRAKASADVVTLTGQIDDLYAKYNIRIDADGNATGGDFGTGPEAKKRRDETIATLKTLLDRRRALDGGENGDGGGLIGKVDASIGDTQSKVNTLGAQKTARQTSTSFDASGGFSGGFNDAVKNFQSEKGLDTSGFKTYTDSFTSLFDKMDTSFGTFIENFVSGNLKGQNAFKAFATSIIQDALKIASQKVASQVLGQLLSFAGTAITGAVGAIGGSGNVAPDGTGLKAGPIGAYQGMVVPKYDGGGIIDGTAIGRDNVLAKLAPGEAILNRSAVGLVGTDMVNQMNSGALRRNQAIPQAPAPREPDLVNVYVVDKNTTPTLGKKDILAAVGEDILGGGATKKLIQQVALGTR